MVATHPPGNFYKIRGLQARVATLIKVTRLHRHVCAVAMLAYAPCAVAKQARSSKPCSKETSGAVCCCDCCC